MGKIRILIILVLAAALVAAVVLLVHRLLHARKPHHSSSGVSRGRLSFAAKDAQRLKLGAASARKSPQVTQVAQDASSGDINMRSRILAFGAGVAALFGTLLARLWGMQLISSEDYAAQAISNLTREVSIRAPRGRILDRNGTVLVGNRSSMALVCDADVASNSRVLRRISNLTGMPYIAVRRAAQTSSEGAQAKRLIMLDVTERTVAYVVGHPQQFPGVEIEARWVRQYPYGTTACHVLGYTGEANDLESLNAESDRTGITYKLGDIVGLTGIEAKYESVLQGIRGVRTVHVDANGDVTGVVSEVPAEQGSDLRLTLDLGAQQAAERAILNGMEASEALDYAATGGACVALNCKTGEILAMASYPDFSPSSFIGGISAEAWSQLQAEDSHTPLLNRAINGQYPPASTMKPFTTLAGLSQGVCGYDSAYYCDGWWTGLGEQYGKWCWNHTGHKNISLSYGIALSCDVVFYEIARDIYYSENPEALQQTFRSWGLGAKTGVDLPGESAGRVPDAQWKWDWFTSYDDLSRSWQPGDTVNIAIGQGDMLATPLQLAYAFSGIARNGTLMWPHLIGQVQSASTGDAIATGQPKVAGTVAVDQEDLSFVHNALELVLSEDVGMDVYFANIPVTVGGKSGTSEASDDPVNPHALFVAIAPMEDPTYVVASFVEHGGGGGDICTSMCSEVLAYFYGTEPQDYIEINRQRGVSSNTGLGVGA